MPAGMASPLGARLWACVAECTAHVAREVAPDGLPRAFDHAATQPLACQDAVPSVVLRRGEMAFPAYVGPTRATFHE
jgi:hypothetical protein